MPVPDQEPNKDHYSVQEIMDRLRADKEKSHRKRRSTQPHVLERRKRRFWLIMLAVAVALLCFAWIILQMMNQSRVEGEIFRTSVNRHLSDLLSCTVDCDRFRSPDWRSAECSNVRLTGKSGVLKDVLLTDLKAQLTATSFFRNEWVVDSLRVDSANLTFQNHTPPKSLLDEVSGNLVPADDGFRLGLSATPAFVSIADLRIAKLWLTWPDAEGQTNTIDGLIASGSLNATELRVEATGGIWHGGIWADLPVERATVTYSAKGAEIESARFRLTEKAQIRASGHISFTPLGPSGALDVTIDQTPIADLLPTIWKDRLHGRAVIQPAQYIIKPGKPNEFSGTITMDGAVIENLPGLAALAHFFGNDLYSKIELRKLTATFRHTPQLTIIENIDGFKAGESRLLGSLQIHQDGRLEGRLELHIHSPEKDLPQFTRQEDGLNVIEFTLGGTITEPTDSLTEQFQGTAPVKEEPSLLKVPVLDGK